MLLPATAYTATKISNTCNASLLRREWLGCSRVNKGHSKERSVIADERSCNGVHVLRRKSLHAQQKVAACMRSCNDVHVLRSKSLRRS